MTTSDKRIINDDIKSIVNAITKKNKLGFRYRSGNLSKEARQIVPFYRDFILKVINNNSLKIKAKYREGYIIDEDESEKRKTLTKRRKNTIVTDIGYDGCLIHELGHACDFWFGMNLALSQTVLIEGDKTLNDIFKEEFNKNYKEIYKAVMDEFKNIIDSTIKEGAYDILQAGFRDYQNLLCLPENDTSKNNKRARKYYQNKLYESGFVETYYQYVTKKCYSILNKKYSPILDALSAKVDFNGFFLDHHNVWYYVLDEQRLTDEFFANMFAAKVTSKHAYFDSLIKYLPRSFNAFERLFVIFYDHIQSNKRFNDVRIKEVC